MKLDTPCLSLSVFAQKGDQPTAYSAEKANVIRPRATVGDASGPDSSLVRLLESDGRQLRTTRIEHSEHERPRVVDHVGRIGEIFRWHRQ